MNDQMELGIITEEEVPGVELPSLPDFSLTAESTPAAIIAWWDDLVAIFTTFAEQTQREMAPIDAELAHLKRPLTGEQKRTKRQLTEQRIALLAAAEAVEFEAYARFEATLGEFSPTLISLLQAAGVDIPDDDEMTVAAFWDCLQRPAIEYLANVPLREIVRREYAQDGVQPRDS